MEAPMRSYSLLLAAAVLASCGAPAEQANRNEAGNALTRPPADLDNEAANRAPAAETPQLPAAAAEANAIPAAFRGTFDENSDACGGPGESRLEVKADELRFHESIGKVRKVDVEGPDAISVEADYQGEGESWRNVRRLRLSGDTLTISGEGTSLVRIRCRPMAPELPVRTQ
jgi:hypothetical protein